MKTLKAGTVLVPKPEHFERIKTCLGKTKYIVTKENEKQNAIIGDSWMVLKTKEDENRN